MVMRDIQMKLLEMDAHKARRDDNKRQRHLFEKGFKVRARYSVDLQWYDAQVDGPGDSDAAFWVTFLPLDTYGNSEQVPLAYIEIPGSGGAGGGGGGRGSSDGRGGSRSRSGERGGGGGGKKRLMEEGLRREREKSGAQGKD